MPTAPGTYADLTRTYRSTWHAHSHAAMFDLRPDMTNQEVCRFSSGYFRFHFRLVETRTTAEEDAQLGFR